MSSREDRRGNAESSGNDVANKCENSFIQWKAKMEKEPMPNLLKLAEDEKVAEGQSYAFWKLLEKKMRVVLGDRRHGPVPGLARILNARTPKPPPRSVLSFFVEICDDPGDLQLLVQKYPAACQLKTPLGDTPLHKVSRSAWKRKHIFRYILGTGTQRKIRFGGLMSKNKAGQTPLALLYASTFNSSNPDPWIWLCSIIHGVAYQHLLTSYFENDKAPDRAGLPLLHAALELGCPGGIVNRLLCMKENVESLRKHDFLGRTPLLTALSCKETTGEVICNIVRKHPMASTEKDSKGNLPLHLALKSDIQCIDKNDGDIFLIGRLVEAAPGALGARDIETQILPFALASIGDRWSIDLTYGLLRTAPWVLHDYAC